MLKKQKIMRNKKNKTKKEQNKKQIQMKRNC